MLPMRLHSGLRVGTPVKFATAHDVFPILVIEGGTEGVISEIDVSPKGEIVVWVYLGKNVEGLEEWHNRVELHSNNYENDIAFCEAVNALLIPTGPTDREEFAEQLAREALDLAARHIQDILGVDAGDYASQFFSGGSVEGRLADYAANEMINKAGEE